MKPRAELGTEVQTVQFEIRQVCHTEHRPLLPGVNEKLPFAVWVFRAKVPNRVLECPSVEVWKVTERSVRELFDNGLLDEFAYLNGTIVVCEHMGHLIE